MFFFSVTGCPMVLFASLSLVSFKSLGSGAQSSVSTVSARLRREFFKTYADRILRPLARLLASTLRPFFVLILALKPWTLLLCLFLGWNVIFMSSYLFRFDNKTIIL